MTRVLAAVIYNDGRVLVGQRPAHKRHGGLWEFPGGKIHPGESDLDAARRELQEELAVEVTSVAPALFIAGDGDSEFIIEFVPTTIVGDPQPLEHSDLRWVAPGDLATLALAPTDRRFAHRLASPRPFATAQGDSVT